MIFDVDSTPIPSSLPLVIVAGPTASGKSALAITLAEQFQGEVVNCDSQQVYRGLDIGTAKLSPAQREGIPHHLIDIVEPGEQFTAAEFARLARRVIGGIESRGRLPILCGGTGFYLRSLLEGLSPAPERNPDLRSRLARREEAKPGSLHRILARISPADALRIHANDVQKTIRALEVRLLSGSPASSRPREALSGHRVIKLVLSPPIADLDRRIQLRTEAIFEAGLVQEVATLLSAGVPESAPSLTSIGYRQALSVLTGKMTIEEAMSETTLRTRQYAKRQRTWFRREQQVVWIHGFGDDPTIGGEAIKALHALLSATPGEPATSF